MAYPQGQQPSRPVLGQGGVQASRRLELYCVPRDRAHLEHTLSTDEVMFWTRQWSNVRSVSQ